MINLLPQKEKQELLFLKNRNLIIVLGSVTIIFLVCLTLVLLSLKFYILQNLSYEKSIVAETEKEYQTQRFLSTLDSIKKYNRALSLAGNFYKNAIYFSDIMDTILSIQRPSGISFDNIQLENIHSQSSVKAIIQGQSVSRDTLLLYRDSVIAHKGIKNVQLPPDNLIKPTNISFNITFEVTHEREQ